MAMMEMSVSLLSRDVDVFEQVQPAIKKAAAQAGGVEFAALVDADNPDSARIVARADDVEDLRKLQDALVSGIGRRDEGLEGVVVEGKPSFFVPKA